MRCIFSFLGIALMASGSLAIGYCEKGYTNNNFEFDLSPLKQDFNITMDKSTPPTVTRTEYIINPCAAIEWANLPKDIPKGDKCVDNTYVCKRIINIKNDDFRVEQVLQIAGNYDSKLDAQFTLLDKEQSDASQSGAKSTLILHGGKIESEDQITNITFECGPDQGTEPNPPTFFSHENGVLALTWKTKHVCGKSQQTLPTPSSGGMSWVEYFFVSLAVISALYFGLGALYNRQVYNAKGWDLIPHRDFWWDLPRSIKDLVMHVYDSFSSRTRGGHGYVSV